MHSRQAARERKPADRHGPKGAPGMMERREEQSGEEKEEEEKEEEEKEGSKSTAAVRSSMIMMIAAVLFCLVGNETTRQEGWKGGGRGADRQPAKLPSRQAGEKGLCIDRQTETDCAPTHRQWKQPRPLLTGRENRILGEPCPFVFFPLFFSADCQPFGPLVSASSSSCYLHSLDSTHPYSSSLLSLSLSLLPCLLSLFLCSSLALIRPIQSTKSIAFGLRIKDTPANARP